MALSLAEDLPRWSNPEKQGLVKMVRAKAGPDESRYLRVMQKHHRLRKTLIQLGS